MRNSPTTEKLHSMWNRDWQPLNFSQIKANWVKLHTTTTFIPSLEDVHTRYMVPHQSWHHVPRVYIFPHWKCHELAVTNLMKHPKLHATSIVKQGFRQEGGEGLNFSCMQMLALISLVPKFVLISECRISFSCCLYLRNYHQIWYLFCLSCSIKCLTVVWICKPEEATYWSIYRSLHNTSSAAQLQAIICIVGPTIEDETEPEAKRVSVLW